MHVCCHASYLKFTIPDENLASVIYFFMTENWFFSYLFDGFHQMLLFFKFPDSRLFDILYELLLDCEVVGSFFSDF